MGRRRPFMGLASLAAEVTWDLRNREVIAVSICSSGRRETAAPFTFFCKFEYLTIGRSVRPLSHRNEKCRHALPFVIKGEDRGALHPDSPCGGIGL